MTKEQALTVFEDYQIRRVYDEASDTWYFSVVDVVRALTDSANPRDYWFKMKIWVKTEGQLELSTLCRQLRMKAPDGKLRQTDCFPPTTTPKPESVENPRDSAAPEIPLRGRFVFGRG